MLRFVDVEIAYPLFSDESVTNAHLRSANDGERVQPSRTQCLLDSGSSILCPASCAQSSDSIGLLPHAHELFWTRLMYSSDKARPTLES